MKTDIQEEALKSAREWLREAEQMGGRGYLCDGQSYRDGYIAGYEAAKAEYKEKSPFGEAYVTERVER